MSQPTREAQEDSDPESSNDSSQLSSSGTTTTSNSGTSGTSASSSCIGSGDSSSGGCNECKGSSIASDPETDGHVCRVAPRTQGQNVDRTTTSHDPEGRATNTVTEERSNVLTRDIRDDVIQRSQSTTGRKCDTSTAIATARTLKTSCPNSPKLEAGLRDQVRLSTELSSLNSDQQQYPSTSYLLDRSNQLVQQAQVQGPNTTICRPVPSASSSSSAFDTNNNKNNSNNTSSAKIDFMPDFRRNNFSKSASGSRLVHKNSARSNVCDCLSQNCDEKEHSNRRHFIENYYNNRTGLPSATAVSTLNISSPLNRLSECDAITKRLLSSPIRLANFPDTPTRRAQVGEVDKGRRASLGTNSLTDRVSIYSSSNQFNSLELGLSKGQCPENSTDDNQEACDSIIESMITTKTAGCSNLKPKQTQVRSLSVCQEESTKPPFRNASSTTTSNLNRAVSLACEPGSSKRLFTIIPLFGCDIEALEQFTKLGLVLPPTIDSAVDHILAYGIDSVGIFRKSGVKSRILTLRQLIEANQDASLGEINRDNEFSIYDIADLVKMWFRELKPTPIMTKELIKLISDFLQSTGALSEHHHGTSSQQLQSNDSQEMRPNQQRSNKPQQQQQSLPTKAPLGGNLKKQIDSTIAPIHKALFSKALNFFAAISSNSEINQMTSQNLAICLTPSLCATNPDQGSIIVGQKALKYCIDNYRILF